MSAALVKPPLGEAHDSLDGAILDSLATVVELSRRLEASTRLLGRGLGYLRNTLADEASVDPRREQEVRELEELIDDNRQLLARVRGEHREGAS